MKKQRRTGLLVIIGLTLVSLDFVFREPEVKDDNGTTTTSQCSGVEIDSREGPDRSHAEPPAATSTGKEYRTLVLVTALKSPSYSARIEQNEMPPPWTYGPSPTTLASEE